MPFQLWHYTKHFFHEYEQGSSPELDPYFEIFKEEHYDPGRFDARLKAERRISSVDVSRVFLKMNLQLIKKFPGKYLKQIPNAASSYYKDYSPYWTVPNNKTFLNKKKAIPRCFLFVFNLLKVIYSKTWSLILMILFLPLSMFFLVLKKKQVLHLFLLIEGAVHYNFLISILSTNAGVNNLRYRAPVEPLILMMTMVPLFYLGRFVLQSIKKRFFPDVMNGPD